MPLIQGKSKKAFGENVGAEMHAGKPQKQALAIAYSIKRKNQHKKHKKMAKGGEVREDSARSESRPMPDKEYNDSVMANHNKNMKALKEDDWTDNPTVKQAQKPSKTKLSRPKLVGSDAFSVRYKDEIDADLDRIDSEYPESDKAQPKKSYDEQGPNRQGPKVRDMEDEHVTHGKPYKMETEHDDAMDEAEPDMKKTQSPLGRYAQGGQVDEDRPDVGWGKIIFKAKGGTVGGAKTSTTGNKTKTGGSNPGGASTGGAGTVTITTGKVPPKGINISNVGGKTAARNAGGMDPSDKDDDDTMMARGGPIMQPEDHGDELMERDDEAHLESMESPSEDEGASDARMRDEEGQDRQGPEVSDMEDEHSTGRKPYYMGGPAVKKDHPHEQYNDAEANEDDDMELNAAHDEHSPDDSEMQPEHEEEEERHNSIAAAIMAKRDRMHAAIDSGAHDMDEAARMASGGSVESGSKDMNMADGGDVIGRRDSMFDMAAKRKPSAIRSHDSIYSDDSDQADLSRNADEDANEEDQTSFNALRKENYSESAGLKQLDSPRDSAQHGDDEEEDSENKHDMISAIRSKMNKHRQFR